MNMTWIFVFIEDTTKETFKKLQFILNQKNLFLSPEQTKVKDAKKSAEAKVSPKSQRTRRAKKMLNSSQVCDFVNFFY